MWKEKKEKRRKITWLFSLATHADGGTLLIQNHANRTCPLVV